MAGVETNARPPHRGLLRTVRHAHGGEGLTPATPRRGALHRGSNMIIVERADLDLGGGGAGKEPCQETQPGGSALLSIRGRGDTPGASAQRGGQAMVARRSLANHDAVPEDGTIRGRGTAPGTRGEVVNGGENKAPRTRPATLDEVEAMPKKARCGAEGDGLTASQRMAALRQRIAMRGTVSGTPAGGGVTGHNSGGGPAREPHGQLGGADAEANEVAAAASGGADAAGTLPARQLKTLKFTNYATSGGGKSVHGGGWGGGRRGPSGPDNGGDEPVAHESWSAVV